MTILTLGRELRADEMRKGGLMDLEVFKFLWAVLLPVILWLWNQINILKDDLAKTKARADLAITEKEAHEIVKAELADIKSDIRALTGAINESMREFDRKIYEVMIEIANGKKGG